MNSSKIQQEILSSKDYKHFINGEGGSLCIRVANVPIVIFKRTNSKVQYYYQVDYIEGADYLAVCEFMRDAIPVLNHMLEQHDLDKLCSLN